jgi:hypothetical protein
VQLTEKEEIHVKMLDNGNVLDKSRKKEAHCWAQINNF